MVLDTMKKAGKPLKAGEIADLSGIDKKEVDKVMKKLKKGEWYEFYGHKDCLLQYNDGEYTKGWWNGAFGYNYHFKGMSDIAKPASERMLKKYGVIKEMKEKKKLNLGLIYLVASIIHLISSVLSFIK
ncbi:hypothetical protein, partial [uncultured Acinetobacter sp.]|uniref:hypothetical protein n=1 Tax=uncultured Acinetobacter sp. TaxID=165433 RepID=UPI0026022AC1